MNHSRRPAIFVGAAPCIRSLIAGQNIAQTNFNGDGPVGPADSAVLLGSWGPCYGCPADLNGDGEGGPADLAILLGNWAWEARQRSAHL